MNELILRLKELLKSYVIAASVSNATRKPDDIAYANKLLSDINTIRLSLAINAEMREIFILQKDVPASASINTTQNVFLSRNDISYEFIRGIGFLLVDTTIAMLDEGSDRVEITRDPVAWQQLFSDIQEGATNLGQQIPFDLPEPLIFSENQSLGLGIKGQSSAGMIFMHGATLKEDLQESSIKAITREFLNNDGVTLYVPSTQLIPIEFKFSGGSADDPATDANGDSQIFSQKNDRSVLLTEVSSTVLECRASIYDTSKNLTVCDTVEMRGIAGHQTNPFTTYYPLPEPHLLRRGSRLQLKSLNGSVITSDVEPDDVLNYLTFRGITL